MKLFTIGYEHATQPDVVDRLKAAGVRRLADVRAVASSRKAGFSKTVLAESLRAAGIDYVQLRELGTPKAGRQAVRHGHAEQMREIYAAHMTEPESEAAFQRLRALARETPTALLCYEADHKDCHRSILSGRLAREDGFEVVNL